MTKSRGIGKGKGGGGAKPGAGRPRGAVNKKSTELQLHALENGISPMEVLLEDMRYFYNLANEYLAPIRGKEFAEENNDISKRVFGLKEIARNCAKDVAPYVHPKLASIDAKVSHSNQETALAELE